MKTKSKHRFPHLKRHLDAFQEQRDQGDENELKKSLSNVNPYARTVIRVGKYVAELFDLKKVEGSF